MERLERNLLNHWIWITWEKHRRTRELSHSLGIELIEKCTYLPRPIRHPWLMLSTWATLALKQPKGLIVQNPSVLLTVEAILLKRIFGYALAVDSHNEGLVPFYKKPPGLQSVYRYLQKKADLTIVTNERLAELVRRSGGAPVVLEDKIPRMPDVKPVRLNGAHNVVCVSTFAKDEPIGQVIEATRSLGRWCYVYVTGDYRKLSRKVLRKLPSNLRMTGFLSDEEYISLLRSSNIVMDLTTLDDCLVCGAYEAVAVAKPIVLNDTVAVRQHFYKGAVYTRNHADAISKAITEAIANLPRLQIEIKELREELEAQWSIRKGHLVDRMRELVEANK